MGELARLRLAAGRAPSSRRSLRLVFRPPIRGSSSLRTRTRARRPLGRGARGTTGAEGSTKFLNFNLSRPWRQRTRNKHQTTKHTSVAGAGSSAPCHKLLKKLRKSRRLCGCWYGYSSHARNHSSRNESNQSRGTRRARSTPRLPALRPNKKATMAQYELRSQQPVRPRSAGVSGDGGKTGAAGVRNAIRPDDDLTPVRGLGSCN